MGSERAGARGDPFGSVRRVFGLVGEADPAFTRLWVRRFCGRAGGSVFDDVGAVGLRGLGFRGGRGFRSTDEEGLRVFRSEGLGGATWAADAG